MTGRFGGRDAFGKDHDRAQELAAARLAEPNAPGDAAWLADHLAWCAPCRAVAAEYETQRVSLRALRLDAPTPPRDLWARTAAAMEQDGAGAAWDRRGMVHGREAATTARVRGRQPFPVAPLAGLLVVAVAVGLSLLNGIPAVVQQGTGTQPPGSPQPLVTPFPVTAREIPLVVEQADGSLVLQVGRIDEACPIDATTCGTAGMASTEIGRIGTAAAPEVMLSPTRSHLVVLDRAAGGGSIYVLPVAALPGPTLAPASPAVPGGSGDPAVSPGPDGEATGTPAATPAVTPAETPVETAGTPVPASPSLDPSGTREPPTPTPTPASSATASPAPGSTTTPGGPGGSEVPVTPAPGGAIAIAEHVVLVGSVAGYAPDGSAFAFTARPADGSSGPDVYVWRTSETVAVPVTDDHDVLFADWLGDRLLVSRGVLAEDGTDVRPVTTLLDPRTGEEQELADGRARWRPAVDPLGRAGVWWDGSLVRDAAGLSWIPGAGRLVLGTWPGIAADTLTDPDGTSPTTGPAADEAATPTPDALPTPMPTALPPVVLAEGTMRDWQVRWDETGTRLAVWVADVMDPTVGRLSLYLVDAGTGLLLDADPLLADAPANASFSLGAGRLAWAVTGDDGTTSVTVLTWSPEGIGTVHVSPRGRLAVIR